MKHSLLSAGSRRTNQSALDRFGDSVQDVMAGIGAPSKVVPIPQHLFHAHCPGFLQVGGQDEDPLAKCASTVCSSSLRLLLQLLHHGDGNTSVFCNNLDESQFQDILFDAKNNKVKKFILHTNFPGHYNFNM